MKTIYRFYTDKYGEMEGMFTKSGKLIGCWSCNDANWRDEYFNGFMERVGVSVESLPAKYDEQAIKQMADWFGLCEDDE